MIAFYLHILIHLLSLHYMYCTYRAYKKLYYIFSVFHLQFPTHSVPIAVCALYVGAINKKLLLLLFLRCFVFFNFFYCCCGCLSNCCFMRALPTLCMYACVCERGRDLSQRIIETGAGRGSPQQQSTAQQLCARCCQAGM